MKVWTKEEIKNLLLINDIMVVKSLVKLYQLQTVDEQRAGETTHQNGVGFNGTDSQFLSSCARFAMQTGYLSQKQIAIVRRKIMKYARQITDIANGKLRIE